MFIREIDIPSTGYRVSFYFETEIAILSATTQGIILLTHPLPPPSFLPSSITFISKEESPREKRHRSLYHGSSNVSFP